MKQNQNFQNESFRAIFEGITAQMPSITFWGIIAVYLITAALNVHFLPLPVFLSIPAALAIQFGRFAVVFTDFLNPTGRRSPYPILVATVATFISLAELGVTTFGRVELYEAWALFLFGGMLISFGYFLEINFISKGAEAFGMSRIRGRKIGATNSPEIRSNTGYTAKQLFDIGMDICRKEKTDPAEYAKLMRSLYEGHEFTGNDKKVFEDALGMLENQTTDITDEIERFPDLSEYVNFLTEKEQKANSFSSNGSGKN